MELLDIFPSFLTLGFLWKIAWGMGSLKLLFCGRVSQGGGRWETRTGRPLLGSVWSLLMNLAPDLSSGIRRNALAGFTPPDGSPNLSLRRFLQVLHASILVKNTEKWSILATFSSLQKLDVDAECTMLTRGLIQRDIIYSKVEKCQETKVVTQDKLSRCARPHRKRNDKTKEKQAESQNYILGISKVDIYLKSKWSRGWAMCALLSDALAIGISLHGSDIFWESQHRKEVQ